MKKVFAPSDSFGVFYNAILWWEIFNTYCGFND